MARRPPSPPLFPSAAPFGSAVNCTACPTVRLAAAGLTATDATGTTLTVIAAVPLWPSLVAVIVAVPAAAPLTSPLPLTVATAALLVAHVTTRPLNGVPLASFGVAASCTVAPRSEERRVGKECRSRWSPYH